MAYTKNHATWLNSHPITTTILNNFETQYTESHTYLLSHNHSSTYYTKSTMNSTFWNTSNDGSGSGSDADLIYHEDGNLHAASFAGIGIATGLIIMWSGVSVPSGWHLCDGTSGTVDLRNKFVLGAGTGSGYSVGNNGNGSHLPLGTVNVAGHSLTADEVKGHTHTFTDTYSEYGSGTGFYSAGSGSWYSTAASATARTTGNSSVGKATADAHTHTSTFTGDSFTVLPQYYALAYIQKT